MKIEKRQTALMQIYREAFGDPRPEIKPELNGGRASTEEVEIDEALLAIIRASANGEQFSALFDSGDWEKAYSSQSEADLALVGTLRFWLWKSGGAAAIDTYFRASALYRDKWDEKRGKQTYGERTISQAIKGDFDYYGRSPDDSVQRQARVKAKAGVKTATKAKATEPKTTQQEGFADFDATIIQEHREKVPTLPLGVFGKWATWLKGTAEAKAAPVDYVVATLLTATASLIGNARWVSPWKGWEETTALWIARVGLPSSGKTPAALPLYDVLSRLEWELAQNYDKDIQKWKEQSAANKVVQAQWQIDLKEAITAAKEKTGKPVKWVVGKVVDKSGKVRSTESSMPFDPPRPIYPRLLTNDTTVEKVGEILAGRPKGILHRRDELSGWLGSFDQYKSAKGGERGFWTEAYNGHGYKIDRIKKEEPTLIKHLTVSIDGGLQPDGLTGLFSGADDGLVARLLLVWPDEVALKRPRREPPLETALDALRRLRDLKMGGTEDDASPIVISLDEDAATAFEGWWSRHRDGSQGQSGKFLSWYGKMPGVVLRLSLVLTYLHWCIEPKDAKVPTVVPAIHVTNAIKLVTEYFVPMARRVFGEAVLPEAERNAKAVAKLIKAKNLRFVKEQDGQIIVNPRPFQQDHVNQMATAETVHDALDELVEAGWLRRIERGSKGVGRPRKDYEVNPRVFRSKQ